jgi:hypothetical protein
MKKLLAICGIVLPLLLFSFFAQTASAQTPSAGKDNFTCTYSDGISGLGSGWNCDTSLYSIPGCADPSYNIWKGGYETFCQSYSISSTGKFYCRNRGDIYACGPDQKTADETLIANLKKQPLAQGKAVCQIDSSLKTSSGASLVVCLPTPMYGCIPSDNKEYSVCKAYPPNCSSDTSLPVPGAVVTCDIPVDPGTQNTQSQPAKEYCTGDNCKLDYQPLEPLPGLEKAGKLDFVTMLNLVFKILITIGALFAVGTLVVGGIGYMVQDAFEAKDEARRRIRAAFFALILIIGSWLILNTINPALVVFNLNPDSLRNGASLNTGKGTPAQTAKTEQEKAACRAEGGSWHWISPGNSTCY